MWLFEELSGRPNVSTSPSGAPRPRCGRSASTWCVSAAKPLEDATCASHPGKTALQQPGGDVVAVSNLSAEKIHLDPRCGPRAPGCGFSTLWPQLEPGVWWALSRPGWCCSQRRCDPWQFALSHCVLPCPEARTPTRSQCAGQACVV